jgi:hypothetical protein
MPVPPPPHEAITAGGPSDAASREVIFDAIASIVRPQDLCVLEFGFINLRSDDGVNLLKIRPGEPSFIVVEFPPQHIAEVLIPLGQTVPPLPLAAHIAGPTRLVFSAEGGSIAYFLEHILHDLSSMPLSVSANAKPPPPAPATLPPPTPLGFEGLLAVSQHLQAQRIADAETGNVASTPFSDPRPTTPIAEPEPEQTAIEIPVRLILSPHVGSGFAHASTPYMPDGSIRVELWNTRLGVRTGSPGAWAIDERSGGANTVRAVWMPDYPAPASLGFATLPSPDHRKWLVEQTADFSVPPPDGPIPIEINRLILTALGGTLDALVSFPILDPQNPAPLEAWRHITMLGRDQYVRIVTSGWLSLGHQASLVEVVERQFLPVPESDAPVAAVLVKRTFLVVRQPLLDYEGGFPEDVLVRRWFPFKTIRITTTTTPNLSNEPSVPVPFLPEVDGVPWRFSCIGTDLAGNILRFDANLAFFPADTTDFHSIMVKNDEPVSGAQMSPQRFAVARPTRPGTTTVDLSMLSFLLITPRSVMTIGGALASGAPFIPIIIFMHASIPALRQSAGQVEKRWFEFSRSYLNFGFDAMMNPRELYLKLVDQGTPIPLDFTRQSDRSGGFIAPNLAVRALSRLCGPYAESLIVDPNNSMSDVPLHRDIDPKQYFADLVPFAGLEAKLFGVINLSDIISVSDILEGAPSFVTDVFDEIGSFFALLARLDDAVDRLVAIALPNVVPDLAAALTRVDDALDAMRHALQAGLDHLDPSTVEKLVDASDTLVIALETERAGANPAQIPEGLIQDTQASFRDALGFIGNAHDLLNRLRAAEQAMESARSMTTRLEWRPHVKPFAGIFTPNDPINNPYILFLRAEIRAKQVGAKKPGIDILASLEDFSLELFVGAPVISINFERLQFSMEAGKKPDVDCVFGGIGFLGHLAFLEIFQRLLPLDGFSDPPSIDVGESGITAGLSLAFPSVGLGIFSLENIAFSTSLQIPFIGPPPVLRFAFSSSDNPFRLSVAMLGGSGFFALTVGTGGVEMLECSLEFGACLSINLGVASGAVSITAGIYLRMQQNNALLAGYVRLRGNVQVLGIVSISLEVRLELGYESGKERAYGRAVIILEISIAFFSISVSADCEKSFSKNNQDPTFAQVMAPEPGYAPWDEYCNAFA